MIPAICFLVAAIIAIVAATGGHLTASPLFWCLFFISLGLLLANVGWSGPAWPWARRP